MRYDARSIKQLCLPILALCFIASAPAQTMVERGREALDKLPHPQSTAEFQTAPSLPCLNQEKTLICWSFATCSFLESEMARLKLPPVRLSVMYPAYCQCLEKVRRFVQTKGRSRVSPGDIFGGVPDACRQYGAMPASVYEKSSSSKAFDQTRLYAELDDYLQEVKLRGQWNEDRILTRVRKILNRHLGEPPRTFTYNGKTCTPQSFLAEAVRLPWAEYISITSFESAPFDTFTELAVPDNWQHHTNFFNVPLSVFYDAFKGALRAGFTVAVEIDTSEPCYTATGRYCLIPDFDIPTRDITQTARELRFLNGATSDDHALHIIGSASVGGEDWFLAKDSWKVAWRDGNQGALFLHASYVKLKVLAFIVHRDGVPQVAQAADGSRR
jgi:bleomycin hydrolase